MFLTLTAVTPDSDRYQRNRCRGRRRGSGEEGESGDEGGDADRDDDEALMDQVYGVSVSCDGLVLHT
jgi:hypothetical protein